MIKLTLLVPLLGTTIFGGYYHRWDTAHHAKTAFDPRQPLAQYAHRNGREDAEHDWANGTRRLFTWDEPAAWQAEYNGMLSRIYEVRRHSLADTPDVPATVKAYVTAYNAVMERRLAERFGPGFLDDTAAMARERHVVNERVRNYVPPL